MRRLFSGRGMRLASVLALGCALAACAKPAPAAKDAAGLSPEETLLKIFALVEAGDEKGVAAFYSTESLKYNGSGGSGGLLKNLAERQSSMSFPAGKMIRTPHPEAKLTIEGIKPSRQFDGVYVVAAVYAAPGVVESDQKVGAEHFPHFSHNFKLVNGRWHVVDDFKGL